MDFHQRTRSSATSISKECMIFSIGKLPSNKCFYFLLVALAFVVFVVWCVASSPLSLQHHSCLFHHQNRVTFPRSPVLYLLLLFRCFLCSYECSCMVSLLLGRRRSCLRNKQHPKSSTDLRIGKQYNRIYELLRVYIESF